MEPSTIACHSVCICACRGAPFEGSSVVWGRRPGSLVVVVTGTDVVVAVVGTLETPEPGRADFGCEGALPHAVMRRAIATAPSMAWTDALNRADVGFGGRVRLDGFAPTTQSVVLPAQVPNRVGGTNEGHAEEGERHTPSLPVSLQRKSS